MRRFFIGSAILSDSSVQVDNSLLMDSAVLVDSAEHNYQRLADLPTDTVLTLPDTVYHHWIKVLRAKEGHQSLLFDGLGGQRLATLIQVDKKSAQVCLHDYQPVDHVAAYYTTVAIVMSRGDRMDYAIQKATEMGATVIQLLTSQYGEVRLKAQQIDKKMGHWQQVALSACEQCGLNRPPLILSPLSIEDWLTQPPSQNCQPNNEIFNSTLASVHDNVLYLLNDAYYQAYFQIPALKLVLAVPDDINDKDLDVIQTIQQHMSAKPEAVNHENNSTQATTYLLQPRFDLLIGAEGGLSEDELTLSRQYNYLPWQIGNRVLRTETAPVVALTALLCLYQSILS